MTSRTMWALSALFLYVIAVTLLFGAAGLRENESVWRGVNGVLYGLFGMTLLGALARILPQAGPNVWRSSAFVIGAVCAAAGAWLLHRPDSRAAFEVWMAALLGIAVAVMLPRWLPTVAACWWLGIEHRQMPDL